MELPEELNRYILGFVPLRWVMSVNRRYRDCIVKIKEHSLLFNFVNTGIHSKYIFPPNQEEYFEYGSQRHRIRCEFFKTVVVDYKRFEEFIRKIIPGVPISSILKTANDNKNFACLAASSNLDTLENAERDYAIDLKRWNAIPYQFETYFDMNYEEMWL